MAKIKVRRKTKQVIGKLPSQSDSTEWQDDVMTRMYNLKKQV